MYDGVRLVVVVVVVAAVVFSVGREDGELRLSYTDYYVVSSISDAKVSLYLYRRDLANYIE